MSSTMQPSSFSPRDADILVVDDTPENLRVVIGLLKKAGYKARGIPNGDLALLAVAKQPPNLILLDIRMPGMDGFQVCEALQKQAASRGIPIIFLSALTDAADKQRAFEAGGVDYITKPFQAKEVLARVGTHLELARSRTALIQTRDVHESHATGAPGRGETVVTSVPPEHGADILVVDDEPDNLRLMTQVLQNAGYKVRVAISGERALKAATIDPPDLVLLDVLMPGMDGYEVCRHLKASPETRDVPVIFVSVASETGDKLLGFEIGAVDYVTKPYQREELLARVRTHLELSLLRNHLESLVAKRTAELMESERKLKSSLLDSVTALASIVEMRDPYTAGHQRRVAQLAVAIAKELQLTDSQVECIHLASVVHDVGKVTIPAELLSKPGTLTPLEFGIIKEHSQNGYDILKTIDFPWPIAQIVLQHHERMDGTGYPQALRDNQILLEARILGVADVVESMMSHRPYRAALGIDSALTEIESNKGKLFDSSVVEACIRLFREKGLILQ